MIVSEPAPSVAVAPSIAEAGGEPDGGEAAEEDRPTTGTEEIREAVASFATKAKFRDAVKNLLAAGFAATDLSILASHDSLEVAGALPGYRGGPGAALVAGLTDEVTFVDPMQIAGFSALAGGPVSGVVAALVTAGLGVAALREVVERLVANRHAPDFTAALHAGGVLLWVRVRDPAQEAQALSILGASGGTAAHVNVREPRPA